MVASFWLLAAVLSVCMGVTQYFGWAHDLTPWVHATNVGEAFSNLRQRNQYASLLSIGLLALLWHLIRQQKTITRPYRVGQIRWYFLLVGVLAFGAAISNSRTGMLQWCLVTAWISWRCTPGLRQVVQISVAAMSLYVFFIWAAPSLLGWMGGAQYASVLNRLNESVGCSSRLTLWSNVLHLIAQKPWFGWGWGELDYGHFITLYPGERFCDILDNAHNLPLHLAVELGIPVAAAFCGMCVWLVWHNKPWTEKDPARQMAWGVLAVIGLHSMLEYPLWYGPFQLAVVLCFWLLWRGPEADVETERAPRLQVPSVVRAVTGAAAVALLALCAYVAWDYWRISQIYLPPTARHAAYQEDTLAKVQGSRLFRDQVQFAELTLTPLNEDNAVHIFALAKAMLHFSPEPRVVEKVIESAVMLHRDDEALFYLQRYKAAFPAQHARWSAALKVPKQD
jgi:hypothetical protein